MTDLVQFIAELNTKALKFVSDWGVRRLVVEMRQALVVDNVPQGIDLTMKLDGYQVTRSLSFEQIELAAFDLFSHSLQMMAIELRNSVEGECKG